MTRRRPWRPEAPTDDEQALFRALLRVAGHAGLRSVVEDCRLALGEADADLLSPEIVATARQRCAELYVAISLDRASPLHHLLFPPTA